SSLFGSSAMGGIINVITLSPDTIAHTDINLQYGFYGKPPAFADYEQYNDFYGVDLTHSGRNGKWSYIFNGATKTNEGHREQTTFTQYNAYGKIGYHFSPNRSLQVSAMYNDILNETPATWLSTLQPYHVAAHRKDDLQHRRELNADFHYVAYAHADVKYSARFYYYGTNADYIFNGDPDNDSTNVNIGKQFIDEEKVLVHRLGQSTQVDVKVGNSHYLISGLELQSDFIDGRPDTVLFGKHKAWNIGAYIQDQWMMGDKLIVTGGLRFDQYKIVNTFSEGNFSPKIAAVYQVSSGFSIRGLIAQAFRNPSISERFTKFEQGAGLSFRPNPSLRSEKLTLSAEVGTKINLTKNLKTDIAVYYNHYKDLISYRQRFIPGEPLLFEVINLNKAIMQGFEISTDYVPWKWLHLQAGYTFLDARDQSKERFNDVLPYKSKHTGYASAFIAYKKLNVFIQARGRSDIHEVFIYAGSEPEGYVIFNSRISYAFNKNFSASFGISNMTNELYEEIERYRMEGRSLTIGLRYSL
ncbi:MAG: TonB-dependent receptor, partial [Saprospiraceae bacterium]